MSKDWMYELFVGLLSDYLEAYLQVPPQET